MGRLPKQTKRKDMIKRFRELGFDGPHVGTGDHPEFMRRGSLLVKLPNTHGKKDIGEPLLKKILAQAGLSDTDWLGTTAGQDENGQDTTTGEPAEQSRQTKEAD